MTFVYPNLFWIILMPFAIFAYLVLSSKEKISNVFSKNILDRLRADEATMPIHLRNIVMFFALFLMIVALARPVIEKGDQVIKVRGISVMVSVDISGSMRSKDVYPNRLEFAKKKLKQLLGYMPTDELTLTAFAKVPFLLAPFTSDKSTLLQIIDGIHQPYDSLSSSNFTALGNLAAQMLKKKNPKILIVVSDGGGKKELSDFAKVIKKNGITLYAILIGTEQGAPVLNDKGKTINTKKGSIAISQLNKDLGAVAVDSGGAFLIAGNGKKDIQDLVSTIRNKFTDKKQAEVKIKDRVELFMYPLMLSVFLLLIGLSSLPKKVTSVWYRICADIKRRYNGETAGIDRWK